MNPAFGKASNSLGPLESRKALGEQKAVSGSLSWLIGRLGSLETSFEGHILPSHTNENCCNKQKGKNMAVEEDDDFVAAPGDGILDKDDIPVSVVSEDSQRRMTNILNDLETLIEYVKRDADVETVLKVMEQSRRTVTTLSNLVNSEKRVALWQQKANKDNKVQQESNTREVIQLLVRRLEQARQSPEDLDDLIVSLKVGWKL